jgi:hypothetical protein
MRANEGPADHFSSEHINRLGREVIQEGPQGPRAGGVKRDWRSFLQGELRMTRQQSARLGRIPMEQVQKIQDALAAAVTSGGSVNLRLPDNDGSGVLVIQYASPAAGLTVGGHLKCTFYADCTGWNCTVGHGLP